MPRVTIEFNLPEEQEDFKLLVNVGHLSSSICEVDSRMRSELKHGLTFESVEEVCEYVRSELRDALEYIY
tara:strand:- start:2638 stop:2847 length:210 start_codon:yes stop_codon:yes gene_type:complete